MYRASVNIKIDKVKKQFLCEVPPNNIIWRNLLENISIVDQELLLNKTVNSMLVLKYPVQTNYQKRFLKFILDTLEKHEIEIHDSLFEAYGRLVALPSDGFYFKHYLNNSGNITSLKETVSFISDGTTGLKTWQAGLVLSEWILKNQELFLDQNILELGSGIGLTGLTIVLNCCPNTFYFSDCHPSVLSTLCDNVTLNLDKVQDSIASISTTEEDSDDTFLLKRSLHSNTTVVLNLPWEDVNLEICEKLGHIDKVIATDIVYDNDLFKDLVNALNSLSKFCKVKEFIFCCTERNKKTLDSFLELLRLQYYEIKEIEVPKPDNFIWPDDTPIRIISFSKKNTIYT